MTTKRLRIPRDQLYSFLKSHDAVKQFELLFQIASEVSQASDTQGISLQAAAAANTANAALSAIYALSQGGGVSNAAQEARLSFVVDAIAAASKLIDQLISAPIQQNNNSITTDYIDLPDSAPCADKERRIKWNKDDGTLDVGLYGGSVLQLGQELVYYAKNTSGAMVSNGTPVMFSGAVGASGKLTFSLAVANGSVSPEYMMGVATQDIVNNSFGYITNFGLVRGIDATGSTYGEVWTDGDLLYFSPTTAGTWTKTKPTSPSICAPVAVVVNAGAGGSGSIFVRMKVSESLSRMRDVYISGATPNDFGLLVYNAATARWESSPASSVQVLQWLG